ncbi:hypothetical protein [Paraburkholderia sp. SIMBA_027]|uniref:hypothetical protein n=1 Tax=Paraburkholderia sp. SIMBA_027 TaxID=3085770 RepID=UPI00397B32EA
MREWYRLAKIRPLRCTQQATRRSEARDETSGFAGSTSFLSGNVKKDVDETKKRLHNLVSVLLTQQRSKRRVVTAHYGAAVEPGSLRDAIFKNLQPISVGA